MQIEIYSSFTRDSKKLSVKVKNDIGDAIAMIYSAKHLPVFRAPQPCREEKMLKMRTGCVSATIEFAFILGMKLSNW